MMDKIKIYDNGIFYSFYGAIFLRLRYRGDEPLPKTLISNDTGYDHVVLKKRNAYNVVVEHEAQKNPTKIEGIVFSKWTPIEKLEKDLVSGNYVFFDEVSEAVFYTENKFFHTWRYEYKYNHLKSFGDVHFFQAKIVFALPETEVFEY